MKIAICVVGLLRNFEYESFIDFIKQLPSEPDIFISTWNIKYTHIPIKDDKNGFVDLTTFKDLNIKSIDIRQWIPNNQTNEFYGKTGTIKALDLKSEYEIKNNFKYDLVYKTRWDISYIDKKFDLPDDSEKYLIVPDLCSHNGVYMWGDFPHDAFFYATSTNIDKLNESLKKGNIRCMHTLLKKCGLLIYEHKGKVSLVDWRTEDGKPLR